MIERTTRVLPDLPEIEELERLYRVRNDLVHDGSLEIAEEDTASIQAIALNLVLRIITTRDVLHTITLKDLEDYFQKSEHFVPTSRLTPKSRRWQAVQRADAKSAE